MLLCYIYIYIFLTILLYFKYTNSTSINTYVRIIDRKYLNIPIHSLNNMQISSSVNKDNKYLMFMVMIVGLI